MALRRSCPSDAAATGGSERIDIDLVPYGRPSLVRRRPYRSGQPLPQANFARIFGKTCMQKLDTGHASRGRATQTLLRMLQGVCILALRRRKTLDFEAKKLVV